MQERRLSVFFVLLHGIHFDLVPEQLEDPLAMDLYFLGEEMNEIFIEEVLRRQSLLDDLL